MASSPGFGSDPRNLHRRVLIRMSFACCLKRAGYPTARDPLDPPPQLDPNWVSGFVDAEGSLTIRILKGGAMPLAMYSTWFSEWPNIPKISAHY